MYGEALEKKIGAAASFHHLARSAKDPVAMHEYIRAARGMLAEIWIEMESGGHFPESLVARIMEIETDLSTVRSA